ncbi:MAG TPA: YihY/virulence factor BrkB family protein [Acidimicrobiales bacterium]|nr:YihY/virulence factor BrkB family protein [Acidimicrobiales bacterium]
MNPIERRIRRLDAFQQRHTLPGFVFGVVKKYGDDNAGSLSSTIAHSLFGTTFPLLLLLVTVTGLVAGDHSALRHDLLHSALRDFPIVGTDLKNNIKALHRDSIVGLAFGIAGLIWGSLGLAENGIFTMMQIWNLPGPQRPNYPKRLLRAGAFLAVLGLGLIVSAGLTALVTLAGEALAVAILFEVGTAVVSCAEFLLAFRVLTPGPVGWRTLLPGAAFAGVMWTGLLAGGELVVGHYLRHDSAIYGLFAIVLGLYFWLYFASELTVYAAEVNVVLARRLWPRAIVQPPITEADQRSMAAQAHQNRRRPEQHVVVTFDGEPQLESRALAEERGSSHATGAG